MSVQIGAGDLSYGGAVVETSGGTKYAIFQNGAYLDIWKNLDGTPSRVAHVTASTIFVVGGIGWIAAAIDSSNKIHVIAANSQDSTRDASYNIFDTSTDSFGSWEEAVPYTDGAPTNPGCAISIDSNDKPHVLAIDSIKTHGTAYDQIVYAEKTGASWTTPVVVNADTQRNYDQPAFTLKAYNNGEAFYHRGGSGTLNAAYNLLTDGIGWGTESTYDLAGSVPTIAFPGVTVDSGGTVRRTLDASNDIEENDVDTGFDTTTASGARTSAALNGTDRYIFYIDTGLDVHLISNSGSGWTDEGDLQVGTYKCAIAGWSYNNLNNAASIDYLFDDGTNVYWDEFTLAGGQTVTGDWTADAILQRTETSSFTGDAILQKTQAGSFTADAYIAQRVESSFTGDAIIQRTEASSFTGDAIVQETVAGDYTADAILQRTEPGSYTADAILQRTESASFTADAIVQAEIAASFTADAILQQAQPGDYTADAILQKTQQDSFTADAYIEVSGTVEGSWTADAIVQRTEASSYTADAYIIYRVAGNWAADAIIQRTESGGYTADAIVQASSGATWSADAIIQGTLAGSYTADAILQRTEGSSWTADAIVQRIEAGSWTADAILQKAIAGSYTADAWITTPGTVTGNWTADAIIQAAQAGSYTADAYIVHRVEAAWTADAILQRIEAATWTADAVIQGTSGASWTADAIVQRTEGATWTADAILRRTEGGSWTADAIVQVTGTEDSWTADAVIQTTKEGSWTADAYIAVTGTVIGDFTADAWIVPHVPLLVLTALGRAFDLLARHRDYALAATGHDFDLLAQHRDFGLMALGRDFSLTGVQIMSDKFGVSEGDQDQLVGEEIVRDLDVSPVDTGGTDVTAVVLDLTAGGADVTSTKMPGTPSISNDVVTLPALKSLEAGHRYEVRVQVTFPGGNKPIIRYFVDAEE